MRPLMVLGCTSDAGKSLLVTALCRWFARQGVRVAPFKAQNMSNNARVVAHAVHGGGEIGVAQWLQARAAGLEPDVRMNPVLLKPESDQRSQVVVRGQLHRDLSAMAWRDRHDGMWEAMAGSFDEVAAEFDLVILEGAGSPAEINLRDQVNNRMVHHADAAALLVSDIDRGGSFAHLFGTWSLVPETTRDRLGGFVLNKFRGDASLLEPGPQILTERTGMANLGVVPMVHHNLPREEGASETGSAPANAPRVVLPRLPFGSNLDEFHPLSGIAHITWATSPASFEGLDPTRDLVVLPGSKSVAADHGWMVRNGLADAVQRSAAAGVRIVGICGGAMMLGRELSDPHSVESASRHDPMLNLLDLATGLEPNKRTLGTFLTFGGLPAAFAPLEGVGFDGYEIRNGVVEGGATAVGHGSDAHRQGHSPVAWASGTVLATTVHGMFESPDIVEALLGVRPEPVLEPTFELLADLVEDHFDTDALLAMTEAASR